jgi:hypothetical protein
MRASMCACLCADSIRLALAEVANRFLNACEPQRLTACGRARVSRGDTGADVGVDSELYDVAAKAAGGKAASGACEARRARVLWLRCGSRQGARRRLGWSRWRGRGG